MAVGLKDLSDDWPPVGLLADIEEPDARGGVGEQGDLAARVHQFPPRLS